MVNAQRAWQNWTLNCQGCHRPDGTGSDGTAPSLAGTVSKFLTVPGGREYLGRVPGVATSALDDADLADVMNWMFWRFDKPHLPVDFKPFTAAELAQLRGRPLRLEAAAMRTRLLLRADEAPGRYCFPMRADPGMSRRSGAGAAAFARILGSRCCTGWPTSPPSRRWGRWASARLCLVALYGGFGNGTLTLRPVFDASAFASGRIFTAASICIMSFLGFDAVSTLAEEVQGGDRRVVARAATGVWTATVLAWAYCHHRRIVERAAHAGGYGPRGVRDGARSPASGCAGAARVLCAAAVWPTLIIRSAPRHSR